jgi:molecular chaperone GrpE
MKKGKGAVAKEIGELKIQLARALADYDNLRKRVEQEKEAWIDFSSERILTKMLPILDMFESAQKHLSDPGLEISIGEFKKVLDEEGLTEIKPEKGQNFDENLHEAIEVVGGKEKGKIAELMLTGWKYKEGKVIRHAKVKVFGDIKNQV